MHSIANNVLPVRMGAEIKILIIKSATDERYVVSVGRKLLLTHSVRQCALPMNILEVRINDAIPMADIRTESA